METQEMLSTVLEKLQGWLNSLVDLLPNFILAVICLIAAYLTAKLAKKYSIKLL